MKQIDVFKLTPEAKLPTRNLATDGGLDIYASVDMFIPTGETRVIETGIAMRVPVGFIGKVEDRSSMARNGLRTGGGVVDTGYSGQLSIVLHNLSNKSSRDSILLRSGYQVKAGDKVAQLILVQVETPVVNEVSNLWESERGSNAFGSSGR